MEISLFLQAGLGNQLFQIAAAYAVSKEQKRPLKIYDHTKKQYWDTLLKQFKHMVASGTEPNWPTKSVFHYEPVRTNILRGFYQSSRYFKQYEQDLRILFEFPEHMRTYTPSSNAVALHIRRGDYVDPYFRGQYDVCSEAYWIEGMKRMRSLYPDSSFHVFSDDLKWCREQNWLKDAVFMEESDDCIALYKMSRYRRFIISNSSFSWWAVWFAQTPEKVIAPSRWFNHTIYDYNDIYESSWILINPDAVPKLVK